eukprot:444742-Hanusia_phi.AAC.1
MTVTNNHQPLESKFEIKCRVGKAGPGPARTLNLTLTAATQLRSRAGPAAHTTIQGHDEVSPDCQLGSSPRRARSWQLGKASSPSHLAVTVRRALRVWLPRRSSDHRISRQARLGHPGHSRSLTRRARARVPCRSDRGSGRFNLPYYGFKSFESTTRPKTVSNAFCRLLSFRLGGLENHRH